MPNTLTGLIPTIYESLDIVSRELTGAINAATRDTGAERAAVGQSILVPIAPATAAADTTPAVTAPNTGDQTVGNVSMQISKSRHVAIRWNGEEQRGMIGAGTYGRLLTNQFAQAFRTLGNEIEGDLVQAAQLGASRAVGTPGTTPFGTAGDLSDAAGARQILDDNGAPQTDLQLLLSNASMANIRGRQSVLFRVNEAGTDALLRDGVIGRLEGFDLRQTGQARVFTRGTGASYTTNTAGYAAGTTQVTLITGTGTILPGDVVTFAGDPNAYVVAAGISAPGTITLQAPGLMQAIPAAATAVTVGNSYRTNVAFSRSAMMLIARPPAAPVGPDGRPMDMADDAMLVTDPATGLMFEVALYRQFMQLVYHVRLAWGVQCIKPAHVALLRG